jgi:hypothetical protein
MVGYNSTPPHTDVPDAPLGRRWPWVLAALVAGAAMNAAFALRPGIGVYDWPKEIFYLFHARHALIEGGWPGAFDVQPAGFADAYPALGGQRTYWANPEVITASPWLLVLGVLKVSAFVKLYYLTHVLLGAVGVALLARRMRLPPPLAAALLALTALGAWPMRHYAMGYMPHTTVLLVPWVALAVTAPRRSPVAVLAASAVCAAVLYQGSVHVFLWTLGGAAALGVGLALPGRGADRPLAARLLATVAASVALGAPKLALIFAGYHGMHWRQYDGFSGLEQLLLFLLVRAPAEVPPRVGSVLWDAALPVGLGGFALLTSGPLALALRSRRARREEGGLSREIRASAVASLLAIGCVALAYRGVWHALGGMLPLLAVERYPSRFLAMASWLLAFVSVREWAALWRRYRWVPVVASALAVATCMTAVVEYQRAVVVATSQPLQPLMHYYNLLWHGVPVRASFDQRGLTDFRTRAPR